MVDAKNLAELSNLSQQLNSQSDNLNKAIAALNDQLAALNLGLEVWLGWPLVDGGYYTVPNPEQDDGYLGKARDLTFLGYCKVKDRWQLAIKQVEYAYHRSDDDDEGEDEIKLSEEQFPLLEAPRAIRIKAVDQFDMLISALKTAAKTALEAIQTAEKLAATE